MAQSIKGRGDAGPGGFLATTEGPTTDEEETIAGAVYKGAGGRRLGYREIEPGKGEDKAPQDEACNK